MHDASYEQRISNNKIKARSSLVLVAVHSSILYNCNDAMQIMCKQCTAGVQAVKKIGVGISGDAHKLQRDFGVQCAGLICLSEEANARLCNWSNGRMPQKWSLAG